MSSLTRWVLAHKRIVVISWILLTIAGIIAAGPASRALNQKFSVPNKEGWETNQAIAAKYNGTGGDTSPLLPVVTLPAGESVDSPQVKGDLTKLDDTLAQDAAGVARGVLRVNRRPGLRLEGRSHDLRDRLSEARPQLELRRQPTGRQGREGRGRRLHRGRRPGPRDRVRCPPAVDRRGDGPGVLLEALLGGLGALIVLAFVFASFLAVVPIMMAVASIMTTFLLLLGLTTFTDVSPIVQFLVALVGLGVAIDYSLLVVSRWREERAHGSSGDEAVQRAMETAGRAVVFSGITVAIGLLALIALPLPFLRSMGYGGMLIPLVSTLVAITLLPVDPGEGRSAARLAAPAHGRQGEPCLDPLGTGRLKAALGRRRRPAWR